MMEMAEWRRPGTVLEDEKRYFLERIVKIERWPA
jgi:hypothetical protein